MHNSLPILKDIFDCHRQSWQQVHAIACVHVCACVDMCMFVRMCVCMCVDMCMCVSWAHLPVEVGGHGDILALSDRGESDSSVVDQTLW